MICFGISGLTYFISNTKTAHRAAQREWHGGQRSLAEWYGASRVARSVATAVKVAARELNLKLQLPLKRSAAFG